MFPKFVFYFFVKATSSVSRCISPAIKFEHSESSLEAGGSGCWSVPTSRGGSTTSSQTGWSTQDTLMAQAPCSVEPETCLTIRRPAERQGSERPRRSNQSAVAPVSTQAFTAAAAAGRFEETEPVSKTVLNPLYKEDPRSPSPIDYLLDSPEKLDQLETVAAASRPMQALENARETSPDLPPATPKPVASSPSAGESQLLTVHAISVKPPVQATPPSQGSYLLTIKPSSEKPAKPSSSPAGLVTDATVKSASRGNQPSSRALSSDTKQYSTHHDKPSSLADAETKSADAENTPRAYSVIHETVDQQKDTTSTPAKQKSPKRSSGHSNLETEKGKDIPMTGQTMAARRCPSPSYNPSDLRDEREEKPAVSQALIDKRTVDSAMNLTTADQARLEGDTDKSKTDTTENKEEKLSSRRPSPSYSPHEPCVEKDEKPIVRMESPTDQASTAKHVKLPIKIRPNTKSRKRSASPSSDHHERNAKKRHKKAKKKKKRSGSDSDHRDTPTVQLENNSTVPHQNETLNAHEAHAEAFKPIKEPVWHDKTFDYHDLERDGGLEVGKNLDAVAANSDDIFMKNSEPSTEATTAIDATNVAIKAAVSTTVDSSNISAGDASHVAMEEDVVPTAEDASNVSVGDASNVAMQEDVSAKAEDASVIAMEVSLPATAEDAMEDDDQRLVTSSPLLDEKQAEALDNSLENILTPELRFSIEVLL